MLTPNCSGLIGIMCFAGSYCDKGTVNPSPCPPTTFGATEGLRNVSECTPCTPGKFCAQYGLLAVEGEPLLQISRTIYR